VEPAREKDAARRKATVLVNRRAGAVIETGEPTLAAMLERAFAGCGWDATIEMVEPNGFARRFEAVAREPDLDLVVIAGGDGSVNAVLDPLRLTGLSMGILPLGTLNIIGRDLGMGQDLATAVAGITSGRIVPVDLVTVNGLPFHSNAGIGWLVTMAVQRAVTRRQIPFSRHLAFVFALLRTLVRSPTIEIEYETAQGRSVTHADAVLVTNNRFMGAPLTRDRLDEGVFELHIVRAPTVSARLAVLLSVLRGSWRSLPGIETITASHAVLHRKGRRKGRIAMDGELRALRYPFEFRVAPGAVRLIAVDRQADGFA
jgi:diacylglycerol kinase family enzyme